MNSGKSKYIPKITVHGEVKQEKCYITWIYYPMKIIHSNPSTLRLLIFPARLTNGFRSFKTGPDVAVKRPATYSWSRKKCRYSQQLPYEKAIMILIETSWGPYKNVNQPSSDRSSHWRQWTLSPLLFTISEQIILKGIICRLNKNWHFSLEKFWFVLLVYHVCIGTGYELLDLNILTSLTKHHL